MTTVSVMACFVCVWALLRGQRASALWQRLAGFEPSPWLVRACLISIVPIFLAALCTLYAQMRFEEGAPYDGWMQTLPLPVYNARTQDAFYHPIFSFGGLCYGIAGTLALGVIAASLRREPVTVPRAFGIVMLLLCVASLCAPAMSTTDPYEYVATGLLGFHSYMPVPGALARTIYAPLSENIPLRGVIYGPLWVAVDMLQTAPGTSVLVKLEMLRLWNVVFLGALYVLLGRAGVGMRTRLLFAMNPAVWYYVVVNPHAEVQGLLFSVGALIAARRSRGIVASVLLACAGLIKLPFLLVGAVTLAPLNDVRRRFAAWAAATIVVAAVSWLVPGPAFWHDFSQYVTHSGSHAHANLRDGWLYVAPLVVVAVLVLLARGQAIFGVAWLFAQVAPLAAPWYLLWGIPYAAVTERLTAFLIAMPLCAALLDPTSNLTWPAAALATALGVVLAVDAYATRRAHGDRSLAAKTAHV
jgi:hypothetical protein